MILGLISHSLGIQPVGAGSRCVNNVNIESQIRASAARRRIPKVPTDLFVRTMLHRCEMLRSQVQSPELQSVSCAVLGSADFYGEKLNCFNL